jgi:hypothetical protein
MRSRIAILSGFLLFSVMFATPAHAGPWSAFVAWLSDLDPKSGGMGIEMSLFCPASTDTGKGQKAADRFECAIDSRDKQKFQIKSSAAFLVGTLNESGGTIFVVPVLGIVEKRYKGVDFGAGLGVMHVGGTLVGGVTQPLIQVFRITVPIPKVEFGVRAEFNVLPNGFPAGAFQAGSAEKGAEFVLGLSVVYLR